MAGFRDRADGLHVSVPVSGLTAEASDVATVRTAAPEAFILVGGGVDEANAKKLLAQADGAIVGTSLKHDGLVTNRLDPERVKGMAEIIRNMG